jgi:hypothetical protein
MLTRKLAGLVVLLGAAALGLGACGHGKEAAPATSAPAPPPPAEPAAESESLTPPPAAAPAPAQEAPSSTRVEEQQRASEGNFAEPPRKKEFGADDLRTAEADFERARNELDSALTARRARPAATAGAPGAGRAADKDDAAAAPKAEKKASEPGCATACRAFSSLGRAASAVCRIAGEKDARCTRAHGVVADAEKRVAACGCRDE